MKRKGTERIDHIKECVENILKSTKDVSKDSFVENIVLQAAITRWIEIIGEATKYIPDKIITTHPEIPWKEMAGMRDIVVHDYDDVNVDEIWNVVKQDIPKLKEQLDSILIRQ